MPSLDEIRESIEARIAELRGEMTSLQAGRAALHVKHATRTRTMSAAAVRSATEPERRRSAKAAGTGRAPKEPADVEAAAAPAAATNEPSTKPAATTSRRPRARNRSRSAGSGKPIEVLLAGKLEAMLRESNDGLSAATIAKRANADARQVRDLLRDLERVGQVRRTGARRTSRWRLITDEERIAERAAELERLSTAKA